MRLHVATIVGPAAMVRVVLSGLVRRVDRGSSRQLGALASSVFMH
jgi:hypothetical protein